MEKILKKLLKWVLLLMAVLMFFFCLLSKEENNQWDSWDKFMITVEQAFEKDELTVPQFNYIAEYINYMIAEKDFDWSNAGCLAFYIEIKKAVEYYKECPTCALIYFNVEYKE
jgi:hypothetical protein